MLALARAVTAAARSSSAGFGGGGSFHSPNGFGGSNGSEGVDSRAGGGVGAGLFANGGMASVTNSTLANNSTAGDDGFSGAGGVLQRLGTLNFRASIIAGNTSVNGADLNGTIVSQGYNLVQDTTGAAGFVSSDLTGMSPLLGSLADNGGATRTLAPQTGSPVVDAVQGLCTLDGTAGGQAVTSDERGFPRPSGAHCDMGAVERTPGALQFSATAYSVSETEQSAAITITRTGGSDGTVGAAVTLSDGTATAPSDYNNSPLAVIFADHEVNKIVNASIIQRWTHREQRDRQSGIDQPVRWRHHWRTNRSDPHHPGR